MTSRTNRTLAAKTPALLHGDPCPGNDLYLADGVRFIDFEQAAIGNGLSELAYLRIGFPTCWCVTDVDAALLAEAERGYRAVWRSATGSEPSGDPTDACVGWLIRGDALVEKAFRGSVDHFQRLLTEDWGWGTVSARERLAYRLKVVAELTAEREDLARSHRLCAAMRAELARRWPKPAAPPRRRPKAS